MIAPRVLRRLGLDRPMTLERPVRDALVLLGIIVAATYWNYLTSGGGPPVDAQAYWSYDSADLYGHDPGPADDAYPYAYATAFSLLIAIVPLVARPPRVRSAVA
ncbi:MAG: hypothetical protein NVS9B8_03020 [Candidatus Limnocylindrales bacterium]